MPFRRICSLSCFVSFDERMKKMVKYSGEKIILSILGNFQSVFYWNNAISYGNHRHEGINLISPCLWAANPIKQNVNESCLIFNYRVQTVILRILNSRHDEKNSRKWPVYSKGRGSAWVNFLMVIHQVSFPPTGNLSMRFCWTL